MDEPNGRLERYLEWIDSEVGYIRAYHDQKERAAWTATAFYVPAIILLGNAASDAVTHENLKAILSVLMTAALGAVFMFVSMQFNRRWVAADVTVALTRLRAELIANPDLLKEPGAEQLPDRTAEIPVWPEFIRSQIIAFRTARSPARIAAAAIRGGLFMWGDVSWGPLYFMPCVEMRTRTEAASYVVLVLATLFGIGALWL